MSLFGFGLHSTRGHMSLFGFNLGRTRGHMSRFCLGSGMNRDLICCKQFKYNAFQFLSIVEILHRNTK